MSGKSLFITIQISLPIWSICIFFCSSKNCLLEKKKKTKLGNTFINLLKTWLGDDSLNCLATKHFDFTILGAIWLLKTQYKGNFHLSACKDFPLLFWMFKWVLRNAMELRTTITTTSFWISDLSFRHLCRCFIIHHCFNQ